MATWTSPNGVEHYQPIRGGCATCGRDHLGMHGRTVRNYNVPGECITHVCEPPTYWHRLAGDETYFTRCDTHSVGWTLDSDGNAIGR